MSRFTRQPRTTTQFDCDIEMLDLNGILRDVNVIAEIVYSFIPGLPATRMDPEEPPMDEVHAVTILSVTPNDADRGYVALHPDILEGLLMHKWELHRQQEDEGEGE